MDKTKQQPHASEGEIYQAEASLKYLVARRGDAIAKKKKYKSLEGMDAIVRYLCDKHHWLPHEVRALSVDDLQILLDGDFANE